MFVYSLLCWFHLCKWFFSYSFHTWDIAAHSRQIHGGSWSLLTLWTYMDSKIVSDILHSSLSTVQGLLLIIFSFCLVPALPMPPPGCHSFPDSGSSLPFDVPLQYSSCYNRSKDTHSLISDHLCPQSITQQQSMWPPFQRYTIPQIFLFFGKERSEIFGDLSIRCKIYI